MPVEYSYTSTPSVTVEYGYNSLSLSTCTERLYLYTSQYLSVHLYLYSPQYLYSTATSLIGAVPVQYSYKNTTLSTRKIRL